MIGDLRTRLPIQFGDDATAELYVRRVARAREDGARLGRRFVVAPSVRVALPSKTWLEAGAEVKLEDLMDGEVPAHVALRQLLESGRVIATGFEAGDDGDEPPKAA